MAKDINDLMDGLYKDGTTSVTKEKVNILRIFLQRAFPDVNKTVINDASALLTVYCCLVTEGKHISVNGHELDAEGFQKLFESYGKKAEAAFDSPQHMYDFYGSAMVVALYVYKYTNGFTNKEAIFRKNRAGDKSERIASAMWDDEIR